MSGWQLPTLTLRWGAYFKPDAADDLAIVQLTAQAKDAGLITKRMALEKLQPTFGIENIDQALEALEEEGALAKQEAADSMLAEQQNLHDLANGTKPGGAGAPGKAKPKPSSGGGVSGGSTPTKAPQRSR